jgi:hypothetical protein
MMEKNNAGSTVTVFATATPVLGNYITNEDQVFMNDPLYFGSVNTEVKFNDIERAIDDKFMTHASLIVGAYAGNDSPDDNGPRLDKSINMILGLINDPTLVHKPRKILMYTNRIEKINQIYDLLANHSGFAGVDVFKISSSDEDKNFNVSRLKAFNDNKNISILINCQMVTDGINIVDLDTVVFVDPKYNKSDIIQIMFRPRSYDEDNLNKMAYILIPQLIGDLKFSSVITVITELYIKNDPTYVKFVGGVNKKDTGDKQDKTGCIIELDEKIKHDVITLTKESVFGIQQRTLRGAILNVLSDYIPRTCNEIWDEICNRNLWKTRSEKPQCASCVSACKKMASIGEINKDKDGELFWGKKCNIVVSIAEFCAELCDMGIYSESEYRENFARCGYSDCYPVNPQKLYTQFNWNMLLVDGVQLYSFDECVSAMKLIQCKVRTSLGTKYCTNDQKNKIVHEMDERIPRDLVKYYGLSDALELSKLNALIFPLKSRR